MNSKLLAILVIAALAIGAAALFLNRAPSTSAGTTIPTSLFPDLPAKVNDVASIDIARPGESFTIQRTPAGWTLPAKGNFPVKLEQVKSAVVGISQLKPTEAKTSNSALYSKLGVQDPGDAPAAEAPPANPEDAPPTQPTRVTLKDESGAVLASMILGTQKWGAVPSLFIRKADDTQSWLAEGNVQVPTDPMQWVERQVLNITRDRIKSVSVVHPADGTEVDVSREKPTDTGFTVANIPPGRELTAPTAPESLVTGVQYLSIDDIAPLDQVGFSDPAAIAVYRTFDGLVVTARTVKKDNKNWLNLSFSFDEPPPAPAAPEPVTPEANPAAPPAPTPKPAAEVKKEAEDLNAKLASWAFAIPEFKAKTFTSTIESLLKPLPAPPPPTEPTPDGPTPRG